MNEMKTFSLLIALISVNVVLHGAEIPSEKVQRDVIYSTNGGVTLKLDIFLPAGKQDKPSPAILYVHGGGWRGGGKSMGSWLNPLTRELIERGYVVVAAVDYRLAPEYKWPAFIHDVKCAVRFLRANAKKYNIDSDHIGTWGSSAGGHLVALLGTADASAKLEGAGYTNQSSRVQAVVDFFGPSDLLRLGEAAEHRERARIVFGEGDDIYKAASPITYVTKDDAPFLIIHGDGDKLVPLKQSEVLHEKLKAAGVSSELLVVQNAGHGINGKDIDPSREDITKKVVEFFDKHLRKPVGK
jgi:acetyl esterase/lipase